MRLSIIVPAYKVEKYIRKCLLSLESQDIPHSDYEIIVTNDGSPDNSRKIVEELQQEFQNIILINQDNQGVSAARNNAIAQAKGNYIMPIDPDDYVIPDTFKKILEKAEQKNLDVLYLGFEIFDSNGNSIWQTDYSQQEEYIYEGVPGYYAARGNDVRDPDRSWAILYKRSMLVKYELKYPKDVPFLEDGLFIAKVFSVAHRVGFDSGKFYQRTTSHGSATVTGVYHSEKAIDGFLKAASDIKEFGEKHDFTKIQKGLIHHGTANFVLLSLFPLVSLKNGKRVFKTIGKIRNAGFSTLETSGVVMPYLKYAQNFNLSPYFFLLKYSIEMTFKKFAR